MKKRTRPASGRLDQHISKSSNHGMGNGRLPIGTAWVIIPSDIDRVQYIKYCFQTGSLILLNTEDGGSIIRDVKIPKHILRDLIFPEDIDSRGSLVSWINVPKRDQVIITGILYQPGEIYGYSEYAKVWELKYNKEGHEITQIWDVETATIVLESFYNGPVHESKGILPHILIKARGEERQSKIHLSADGYGTLYGDLEARLRSEDKVTIMTGSLDDEISILTFNRDGLFQYLDRYENQIFIDGENGEGVIKLNEKLTLDAGTEILIGEDATEPAVLGDKLISKLEGILDGIIALTVPTAMGPSGTPVNAGTFTAIKNQLAEIKSTLVKIE